MPNSWFAVRSVEHVKVLSPADWAELKDAERAIFNVVGEFASEQEAEKALRPATEGGSLGKRTKSIKIPGYSPRLG